MMAERSSTTGPVSLAQLLQELVQEGTIDSDALLRADQVATALRQLHLQPDSSAASTAAAADEAWLAGDPGGLLGASADEVLQQLLPSQAELQAAHPAALTAVQEEAQRRLSLVARAVGWSELRAASLDDEAELGCLLENLEQLQVADARRGAAAAALWQEIAAAAAASVEATQRANAALVTVLKDYKLGKQKERDEDGVATVHDHSAWLVHKLRRSALQLQDVTYTEATLPALRQVAAHVAKELNSINTRVEQAQARLQQYKALGPSFIALAVKHIEVQRARHEAEYEVAEIEAFQRLQEQQDQQQLQQQQFSSA